MIIPAFIVVFLMGNQTLNVAGRHFVAAFITSVGIGGAQIFLWRLVPNASQTEIVATLAGGPCGIVAAMWAHPKIAAMWRRT